jgi:hypothetical protein
MINVSQLASIFERIISRRRVPLQKAYIQIGDRRLKAPGISAQSVEHTNTSQDPS